MRLLLAAALSGAALSPLAKADDAALSRRIEQQQRQIDALQKQVQELSNILANRITKVETQSADGKAVMTTPTPRVESPSGDFSAQLVGTIQASAAFYDQDIPAGSRIPVLANGTEVRRAQFGLQGTAFRDVSYAAIFDLAATGGVASSVRDLTVAYSGFRPFTVTVGNQKPQSGMEASFSDRNNGQIFIEPALSTDLATPLGTRFLGVRISTGGESYSASLGVYGDDINNNGVANPVNEGWGVHGRASFAPLATADRALHFGTLAYWRRVGTGRAIAALTDPALPQFRLRSRPESAVDGQRLVDTGNLNAARSLRFLGVEAAGVAGPLSVQAEYQTLSVAQRNLADADFRGGYVEASYFFTGEARNYDPRAGTFGRVRVNEPFEPKAGKFGALELAARTSFIDLNDNVLQPASGGVRGGYETNYTAGLNWYWNSYLRLMFNYVHADVRRLTASDLNAGGAADIYSFRIHQEW